MGDARCVRGWCGGGGGNGTNGDWVSERRSPRHGRLLGVRVLGEATSASRLSLSLSMHARAADMCFLLPITPCRCVGACTAQSASRPLVLGLTLVRLLLRVRVRARVRRGVRVDRHLAVTCDALASPLRSHPPPPRSCSCLAPFCGGLVFEFGVWRWRG